MIKKYFKIWIKTIKGNVEPRRILVAILELISYFLILQFLILNSLVASLVLSVFVISFRLLIQLFIFYKEIVDKGLYNQILLKPVDPLFGLLVYHQDPVDIIVLIPILIFIKIKNYIKINQKK